MTCGVGPAREICVIVVALSTNKYVSFRGNVEDIGHDDTVVLRCTPRIGPGLAECTLLRECYIRPLCPDELRGLGKKVRNLGSSSSIWLGTPKAPNNAPRLL